MSEKSFQIRNYSFDQKAINNLAVEDHLEESWPVVYQIYNNQQIYIGETTNLKNRMNQHLANVEESSLRHGSAKVVFDETFNKSAYDIIIGNDLIYRDGKLVFNRKDCADSGAMKRSQRQVANDEQISEDDMLEQVLRIYRILMNRAVKGVYIYACDEELEEYPKGYFGNNV